MFLLYRFSAALLVALLGITPCFHSTQVDDKQPGKEPAPREWLRYDGKPFTYWQAYWQTELKAEHRIECLRAMGSFGINGYGPEAAKVIVDIVRSYPEDGFLIRAAEPEKLSPDERVYYEAFKAMRKIGAPGVSVLLAHASNSNSCSLARELLAGYPFNLTIPSKAVPTLVQMVLSPKREERDLALDIIHVQAGADDRFGAMLAKALTNPQIENDFLKVILRNMRFNHNVYLYLTEELLCHLSPHCPNFAPLLIAELRGLKKVRQIEVEIEKKDFSPNPFSSPLQPPRTWETHLAEFLSDSRNASVVIVNQLGNIGPNARDALPELRDALNDPYLALRVAAEKAIQKITEKMP